MFGKTVKGIEGRKFEHILDKYKAKTAGKQDTDLTVEMLKKVVADFKALYDKELGVEFPDDVHEQMSQAIEAVFASWFGKRAVDYRNSQQDFARPGHGRQRADDGLRQHGQRLGHGRGVHAQPRHRREGPVRRVPDQRAGRRRGGRYPHPQEDRAVAGRNARSVRAIRRHLPIMLEKHYRDVQDMEFTVERGKLWMLQTRTGKRTAQAAVKIAVDMANEGLISKEEALQRLDPMTDQSAAAAAL